MAERIRIETIERPDANVEQGCLFCQYLTSRARNAISFGSQLSFFPNKNCTAGIGNVGFVNDGCPRGVTGAPLSS